MAAAMFGGACGRTAPARNDRRRAVARLIAADVHRRRRIGAYVLGLDDAGFATALCDRAALERAGRSGFPI